MRRLSSGVALLAFAGIFGVPVTALADTASEIKALKAKLKELEAKIGAQGKATAQVKNALNSAKAAPGTSAPPPVFVSFRNGLFVETEDQDFSFKLGGQIQADGGFASSADTISRSNVGFRRARLEVEGKAFKNWFYKLQYDFTGSGAAGIRDFYLAYRDRFLPEEITKQPVTIQIGNFKEPFSLEAIESSKYFVFVERSLPSVLSPSRHIGAAIAAGDKNWSIKTGIFSTSPQDTATAPPTGESQYWDAAVRGVYAPIVEEDRLLHLGASFKYHKPNNTTAATDAANLRPGQSSEREETDVLGGGGALTRVSAAQDLSCAGSAASLDIATTGVGQLVAPFARRSSCLKYSYNYGFEAAAAYGPVSLQAEYIAAQYERDFTNALIYGNGGGTSLRYSGYYVFGSVFLTGESRAASYKGYDKDFNTPGSFGEVQIKNPLNKGGLGAFEFAARYSEINLDNGGLVDGNFVYAATAVGNAAQKAIARTATLGGRQDNLTLALNWYPVRGVRFQANWTKTLTLVAPSDRPYLNGDRPSLFLARAQVFW
ncbi:OprO/OprP family phosphate-selective porin [Methylosinus sp. Ce-a6]|uniref:OprO/OprP family phosphate-selective porin n=1 Tax=Methylosinus sp. Ce-a6 TaxID=2172005 RepID=UPI001FCE6EEC|nr:porin [Methylosinus sp. Ce-a6]